MKLVDYLLMPVFSFTAISWWTLMVVVTFPIFILGKVKPELFRHFYQYLHQNLLRKLFFPAPRGWGEYIKSGSRVLDLGAGSGLMAKEIARSYKAKVTLCDVGDFNQTDLPLVVFDGKKLPFKDNSFDVVLISFVLHHAVDFESLLKEARRVSKKTVIILEDNKNNLMARIFTFFHGWSFNFFHKINNRCSFFSQNDWEKIFIEMGYTVRESLTRWRRDSLTYPVKECLFVLAK